MYYFFVFYKFIVELDKNIPDVCTTFTNLFRHYHVCLSLFIINYTWVHLETY